MVKVSASESPDFMALYKLVFNFNFKVNLGWSNQTLITQPPSLPMQIAVN